LIALSLLDARGDLARGIATAARCGWSTSCTCGAVGAITGVMLGGSAVAPEWQDVIGVAAAPEFHLGSELVGLPSATTLASLVTRTYEAGRLVAHSQSRGRVELVAEPPDQPEGKSSQSASGDLVAAEVSGFLRDLATGPYVTYHKRVNLGVHIDYDARPTVGYDVPRRLTVTLANLAGRSVDLSTRIAAPPGFVVTFNSDQTTLPEGGTVSFSATISAPREHARISAVSPCTLFVSAEGGEEEAAPITLIGEALWHAAGPYGDFDQSYPPEHPGILSGETALGGEGWQPLSVVEPAVNLLAGLEGERGVYYLATDLLAPRARQARLRVACNDGTRVWCNGQQLWQQHEHRPADARVSADEVPAELREGWNRLVIKMAQCSPRRLLSVVVKDPDGQILVEVVNTAPPPEKG